jgi:thiol-disulfide isomerase/thioredoxin
MRIFFVILFSFISLTASAEELPLNVGGTAPDWILTTNTDETLDYYADSEDKVSVILFWSTGSPYSATLMPHLEVVYRKFRSKGLKFYAINIKEDGAIDPVKYFEDKKYSYTMLQNGDEVAKQYGVRQIPGVYAIGKDKKVVYKKPSGASDVLVKQNLSLRVKQALAK